MKAACSKILTKWFKLQNSLLTFHTLSHSLVFASGYYIIVLLSTIGRFNISVFLIMYNSLALLEFLSPTFHFVSHTFHFIFRTSCSVSHYLPFHLPYSLLCFPYLPFHLPYSLICFPYLLFHLPYSSFHLQY